MTTSFQGHSEYGFTVRNTWPRCRWPFTSSFNLYADPSYPEQTIYFQSISASYDSICFTFYLANHLYLPIVELSVIW